MDAEGNQHVVGVWKDAFIVEQILLLSIIVKYVQFKFFLYFRFRNILTMFSFFHIPVKLISIST